MLARQSHIRSEWLSNPDDFWYTLEKRFQQSSEAVASLINDCRVDGSGNSQVSPQDIVIVDSLTYGMALLIQSIISSITQPDTAIILSNFTYNAVKLAVQHYAAICRYPPEIFVAAIPFPLLNESTAHHEIISAYEETLEKISAQNRTVVLGLLDHIVSLPSMLMPIDELIQLFRKYGVKEIIVDGAHAPGQIDISAIPLFGANYYVANLHKWCFAPTSAAFIWMDPLSPTRVSGNLHHPIVSHSYSKGLFAECAMLGTKDYSAMLAVPTSLSFFEKLGGIRTVGDRNHRLCWKVMNYLSESWNTLDAIQPKLLTASMGMIALPVVFGSSWESSEEVRIELREKYRIVVQKPFPIGGDRLYLRISVAVYNNWEEYEVLKTAILEMVDRRTK